MSLLLALLVALLAALMLWAIRGRYQRLGDGPVRLRILGGLFGMGLAFFGAWLLVGKGGLLVDTTPVVFGPVLALLALLGGTGPYLGVTLAISGPILAVLAVLGGDLLWAGRRPLGAAALVGVIAGLTGAALMRADRELWPLVVLAATIGAQSAWLVSDLEARSRLQRVLSHTEPWMVLLVLAALVRIPVPLWPGGFPLISAVQMGLITLAALLWGWRKIGARIVLLGMMAFAIGLTVEIIGSGTGFPFGAYSYAGAPEPTILGVPIIVPLGWFALVLSAHVLAGGRPWLAGLLVLAWDLGLEALMTSKGYWTWHDPKALWYGAPVHNYLAWFVVGALISWLFSRLAPELQEDSGFAWAYRLEALFVPAGLVLLGLWPAALLCGLAMNALAWRWNSARGRNIETAS